MSIIDKVNEAEAKALEIKEKALSDVNQIILDAVNSADLRSKEMLEECKKEVEKLYLNNELEIKRLTDDSYVLIEQINKNNSNLAYKNQVKVTDFIKKKVIEP